MSDLFILALPVFVCVFWSIMLYIPGQWKKDPIRPALSLIILEFLLVFIGFMAYYFWETGYMLFYENIYVFSLLSIVPSVVLYFDILILRKKFTTQSLIGFIPAVSMLLFSVALFLVMTPLEEEINMKWIVGKNIATEGWGLTIYLQFLKKILALVIMLIQIFYLVSYVSGQIKEYEKIARLGGNELIIQEITSNYRFLLYLFFAEACHLIVINLLGVPFFINIPCF